MPNHEIASSRRARKLPDNHPRVPFHTCIRLEDERQARTSSIDAEWETLSAVVTEEYQALPVVTARPRMETLPGIGIVDQPVPSVPSVPSVATLPRRRSAGSRLFISVLAATLTSTVAFVSMSAWPSHEPNSVAIAVAAVPLAPPPRSAEVRSPSLPSPIALAPRAAAMVSTATHPTVDASARRPVITHSFRARKVALAPTDNPY